MNGIPNNFISNNVNSQVVVQPWTDPYNPIWGADPKPHEDPIQNAVADIAQITPQAQEKPQSPVAEAIANITGSQDSKPEQSGIGSIVGNSLSGLNSESMQDMPTRGASASKKANTHKKPQNAKTQGTKPNQAKPQNAKPNQEKPQSAWQGIVNIYHGVSNAVNTVSNAVNTVSDAYHGVVDTVSTVSHAVIDPIADVAQVLEETTTVHGLTHPNSHHHNYEYDPETNTITATPKK